VSTATAEPTPTAAPRAPGGFWLAHSRYRSYVLFAASGLVLAIDCLILLRGVQALAGGVSAWQAYLAALATPGGIVATWLLLVSTLLFALRWLRVGAKIPPLPLGLLFSLPTAFFLVGQYAAFAALSALLLLILSGVIL
jgi:fumarate reductase subunit C